MAFDALTPRYTPKQTMLNDAIDLRKDIFNISSRNGDQLGKVPLDKRLEKLRNRNNTRTYDAKYIDEIRNKNKYDFSETMPETNIPVMGVTGRDFIEDFQRGNNNGINFTGSHEGRGSGFWVHHANGRDLSGTSLPNRNNFYASRVLKNFDIPTVFTYNADKEDLTVVPNAGYEAILSGDMPKQKRYAIHNSPYTQYDIYTKLKNQIPYKPDREKPPKEIEWRRKRNA